MKFLKLTLVLIALTIFSGCATTPAIEGTPAQGSKFAKLKLGMSQNQVTDLIGLWSDYNTTMAATAYIPIVSMLDSEGGVMQDMYYKNEGTLTFKGANGRLVKMVVDKDASGYR